MKVTIDKSAPKPSDDEIEDIESSARKVEDATPEELAQLREQMINVKEVIVPQYVIDQLEAEGVSADELVAMLMKQFNAAN